jgi:hypothetical protein
MEDHVYLDGRHPDAVIRSVEADVKALTALVSAMLRTLAATSPAVIRAVSEEARHAAKSDPVTGRHVQYMLDAINLRLSLALEPAPDINDLEWTPIQPPAKG